MVPIADDLGFAKLTRRRLLGSVAGMAVAAATALMPPSEERRANSVEPRIASRHQTRCDADAVTHASPLQYPRLLTKSV